MNINTILEKYYKKDSPLYNILVNHSMSVAQKAISIALQQPALNIDTKFLREAAMLHDIGIFLTNAPSIECYGTVPYICHGYLGRELLDNLGYPRHALVCERHTGTGLSLNDIISHDLPVPHRNMQPESIEEIIICFADCFYSKTKLGVEKTVDEVRHSLQKYGESSVLRFDQWCHRFL